MNLNEVAPDDNLAEPADTTVELVNRQWFFRRKIAFWSLYTAILILTLVATAAFYKEGVDGLSKLEMFLTTGLTSLFALTGAYMGFATWGDIKGPPVRSTRTPPQG